MSTRSEHYTEAERLIALAESCDWQSPDPGQGQFAALALAAAQAHATLATVPVPDPPQPRLPDPGRRTHAGWDT